MIEQPPSNGNGPVTLGEVYRLLLRIDKRLGEHEKDHAPSGSAIRWGVGVAVSLAGLALTLAASVAAAKP